MSRLNLIFVSLALLILPLEAFSQLNQQNTPADDTGATNHTDVINHDDITNDTDSTSNKAPYYNNGYSSGYNHGYNPGYNSGYNERQR